MTLEELNARMFAIDDCRNIIFELSLDSGRDNPDVTKILNKILGDLQKLRDDAWNEFEQIIHELSKQA